MYLGDEIQTRHDVDCAGVIRAELTFVALVGGSCRSGGEVKGVGVRGCFGGY